MVEALRFLEKRDTEICKVSLFSRTSSWYNFVEGVKLMARRITEDHKDFRDVYSGRIRKALKKFIKTGRIFRLRGDGKKVNITIPKVEMPHIGHTRGNTGVGRGMGKIGDVIDRDPPEGGGNGKGQGNSGGGGEHAEGVTITLDMDDVFAFMRNELALPDLKPKPSQVYEEVKIRYDSISLNGPESLRHNRRTMLQAMKRMAAGGEIDKLHKIPGFSVPVKLITPINTDRRYRQYHEIRIPSNNAVIFFARDGSGSMDDYKCDIVSDMAWWIDAWIRRFYKRVERVYVWHDTEAEEVDEKKFYNYRYGGGTMCSSAMKMINAQLVNRYPPSKWNVYVIYFTDGENWNGDNEIFNETIAKEFPPEKVNFVGVAQIMCWMGEQSLKAELDEFVKEKNIKNVRTTEIGNSATADDGSMAMMGQLSEDERDAQIKRAIMELLGVNSPRKAVAAEVKGE